MLSYWEKNQETFFNEDGSLVDVEIKNLTLDEIRAVYERFREISISPDSGIPVYDIGFDRQLKLDHVEDPIARVATGELQPFHFMMQGTSVDGTRIPDLGIFVFSKQLEIDFRPGSEWTCDSVAAFRKLLAEVKRIAPKAIIEMLGDTIPSDEPSRTVQFSCTLPAGKSPDLMERIRHAMETGKGLDLSGLQLESLPDAIFELDTHRSIRYLNLSNNRLTSLPPEIGRLKELTNLDLSNNALTQLPASIGRLTSLSWLSLAGNQLAELPTELSKLRSLKHINITSNNFQTLPEPLSLLSELDWLYASKNSIAEIPTHLKRLQSLSHLDLSHNAFHIISSIHLPYTKSLDLQHNHLEDIDPEILQMTGLESLDLRANQLRELPDSKPSTTLKHLNISENNLTQLGPELLRFPRLQNLYLNQTQLETLGPEIGQLRDLRILNLHNNLLHQLPLEILHLKNLQLLIASNNHLTQVPQQFKNLPNLRVLDISSNPI